MYLVLLVLVSLQRFWELQIAASNEAHLKRRGAVEFGGGHYPVMVGLHALWLLCCFLEWRHAGAYRLPLVGLGAALLLGGQALRWATIRTLGRRWTTRVFIIPGAPLVKEGPFRWLDHPNYLGVAMELFGLPLVGGCWRTSLLFGIANLALLRHRIRVENHALEWGRKASKG